MTRALTTMRTLRKYGCAACVVALLVAAGCTQPSSDDAGTARAAQPAAVSKPASHDGGATRFAPDDEGQPGAGLPDAVVRALGTDERVLSCEQGTRDGVTRFAPDWVAARRVDLDDDGRADWVVNGRHACLRNDGEVGWWVYADTADAPRLLLSSAMAASLEVLPSRTNGFRDLRLLRGEAGAVARYDGDRYALPATPADSASATEASPRAGPLDTAAGRVEIAAVAVAGGDEAFRVTLDGREIRRTGDGGEFEAFPEPTILHHYPQGIAPFDDVVVFQQQMRGNACNGGPLWILGLHRDGRATMSESIDFCGGRDPVLSATPRELTITLPGGPPNRGAGRIPTEIWRYRDGEVAPAPP